MKKCLLLIVALFLLTGCQSTIEYNFNDNIESNITISFTLDEYKNYASKNYGNDFEGEDIEVIKESIDSRRKIKAFMNTYDNLYKEKSYVVNNNYYEGSYSYIYTYSNFSNNGILDYCFENFNVTEDDNAYYISLGGESKCAGTKFVINAPNRMINSNSKNVVGSKYTWNINSENNDIYFAVSKIENKSALISPLSIIMLIMAGILIIVTCFFNKKYKRNNY